MSTPRGGLSVAMCAVVIVVLSVEATVVAATGGSKLLVIVPIALFAGLGLALLGVVNFEAFVYATIVVRASMDIVKTSPTSSGTAGVNTAAASGLDPAGGLAVIFILMAFFWYLTRKRDGRAAPRASIHRVCLILFAGAGYLSIIDSASVSISLLEAIRVTAVVVMLAVLEVLLVDRESIKRLIAAIYVSALVPVGLTMFNVVFHHTQFTSGGFSRFEGTFSQPNPFAIYLTMLIVMGAALFPHLTQKKKIGMAALLFFSLVCLYYTFTRSAWIACVIGLFAVAIMGRRRLMLGLMVGGIMVSLVALPSIAG